MHFLISSDNITDHKHVFGNLSIQLVHRWGWDGGGEKQTEVNRLGIRYHYLVKMTLFTVHGGMKGHNSYERSQPKEDYSLQLTCFTHISIPLRCRC